MKRKKLLWTALLACVLIAGCGPAPLDGGGSSIPPADETGTLSEEVESAPSANGTASSNAGEETTQPIYGNQIQDGTYPIGVTSSSSMFRIVDAQLTVADGKMSAVLTLGGKGYEKLYMGTGEEALVDTEEHYIYFAKDADGKYTYTVPVQALDQETCCAAFSLKKQKWYDRTLVFESALIPAEAIFAARMAQPPADGQYTAEVVLTGGTGRVSVQSPAKLSVKDGTVTATLVWSSPFYESMRVDGAVYDPVAAGETSVFEIPVMLDRDLAVSARTVAMSQPHEIDYILRFDSATLKPLE